MPFFVSRISSRLQGCAAGRSERGVAMIAKKSVALVVIVAVSPMRLSRFHAKRRSSPFFLRLDAGQLPVPLTECLTALVSAPCL